MTLCVGGVVGNPPPSHMLLSFSLKAEQKVYRKALKQELNLLSHCVSEVPAYLGRNRNQAASHVELLECRRNPSVFTEDPPFPYMRHLQRRFSYGSKETSKEFEFEWLGLFPTLWHILIALCPCWMYYTMPDLNVVLLDPALAQAACRVVLGFLLVQLLPSSPFGILCGGCDVLDPNSCCVGAFLLRFVQIRDLGAYCFTSGLVGADSVPELH